MEGRKNRLHLPVLGRAGLLPRRQREEEGKKRGKREKKSLFLFTFLLLLSYPLIEKKGEKGKREERSVIPLFPSTLQTTFPLPFYPEERVASTSSVPRRRGGKERRKVSFTSFPVLF